MNKEVVVTKQEQKWPSSALTTGWHLLPHLETFTWRHLSHLSQLSHLWQTTVTAPPGARGGARSLRTERFSFPEKRLHWQQSAPACQLCLPRQLYGAP